MTHKRIRKFNTKDTYPEQKLDNDLCQVVVAKGSMVFVRGQVGQELDTAVNVAIGDAAGQTEQHQSTQDGGHRPTPLGSPSTYPPHAWCPHRSLRPPCPMHVCVIRDRR